MGQRASVTLLLQQQRAEEGMGGIRPAPATTKTLKEAQAFLTQAVICES